MIPLTEMQRLLAGQHVGEDLSTEPMRGRCFAWFPGPEQDTALLVCKGRHGLFTWVQPLPVEDAELERRRFVQEANTEAEKGQRDADAAEAETARQAVLMEAFGKELAQWVGVDPDDADAVEALRKDLAARAAMVKP